MKKSGYITMRKIKNVSLKRGLLLLTAVAFVALCTFNVIRGLSDHGKTLILFNLEALAGGGGNSETSTGGKVSTIIDEECGTTTFYNAGNPYYNPYCSGQICPVIERFCIGRGNLPCQEGMYVRTDLCTSFNNCSFGGYA
jgi:hypothetical protein